METIVVTRYMDIHIYSRLHLCLSPHLDSGPHNLVLGLLDLGPQLCPGPRDLVLTYNT